MFNSFVNLEPVMTC